MERTLRRLMQRVGNVLLHLWLLWLILYQQSFAHTMSVKHSTKGNAGDGFIYAPPFSGVNGIIWLLSGGS